MNKKTLSQKEKDILQEILKKYKNVVIFGSRVNNTNKKFSDLDICLKEPISGHEYVLLQEKFEKSDLPFTVDIIEYDKISISFKDIIDREGIPLDLFLTLQ